MERFGLELPQLILALAVLFGGAAAPAQAPVEGRELLALCTDDDQSALAALAEELQATSHFVELLPSPLCSDAPAPPGAGKASPRFWGRFEADADGGTVLVLVSSAKPDQRRSSLVPWLDSPARPIAATVGAGKTRALALLIDGLILDFRNLSLTPLPVAQSARKAAAPESAPSPAPALPPPLGPRRPEVAWGLELGAGAVYLSPDAAAPRLELGGSLGTGRWRAVANVHAELDSSFEIGDRRFTTFTSGARLGARYLFLLGARSQLGAELAAVWIENRYRRDGLAGARARTWADFGAFLGLSGRARLGGPVGVFLRVGVAICPTARFAVIGEGPQKRVNLVTVPAVAGFDFDF